MFYFLIYHDIDFYLYIYSIFELLKNKRVYSRNFSIIIEYNKFAPVI